MVWEMASAELARQATSELTGGLLALASWAWKDPALETGQSHGWRLAFNLEVHDERYVVLTLRPEPDILAPD